MAKASRKTRVDVALVEAGLVESRQKAQVLILAGKVRVAGDWATSRAGESQWRDRPRCGSRRTRARY